jgi:hypothetical protein
MSTYKKTTLERVEFHPPAHAPAEVPLIVDDWTLAFRLGFTGKALWYFTKNRPRLYKVFKIKKATGGFRTIHNPDARMRILHKQMRSRLLLPLCEKLGPHVSAYQVGQGTRDAALKHMRPCAVCEGHETHTCTVQIEERGKGFKLARHNRETCVACQAIPKHDCPRQGVKIHLDLKDFFGSTKRAWIRRYFQEVVGYNFYVSGLLATLLTVEFERKTDNKRIRWNGVPQGAPSSGDICNLVADWRLDQPLLRALEGTPWAYTRYADDLYFSHPENLSVEKVGELLDLVEKVATKAGYRLNRKKKHVQRPHRRQQLLGIVLNRKISIPRDQYRKIRSILYNCAVHGFNSQAARAGFKSGAKLEAWLQGKISYYKAVEPQKADRLKEAFDFAIQKHRKSEGETFEFVQETAS